MRVLD